jgi:hypothetical protein
MTITDASIRLGDVVYVLLGGRVQPVGQAVQNGSVTVSFSTDPDFIVAAVPHLAVVGANAVVVGTSVRVTLTCAAIAPCSGTARLSVRMPNGRWQWVAQAGPGRFALGAGSTGALRLTLTPSSRLLLAKAKASHEALVGRLVLSLRGGPPSVHPVSLRQ